MIPAEIMGPVLKSNVRNFKVQILDILAYMLSFFFFFKIDNLLHGVQGQTMVATS